MIQLPPNYMYNKHNILEFCFTINNDFMGRTIEGEEYRVIERKEYRVIEV